jgi:hypothetical protein
MLYDVFNERGSLVGSVRFPAGRRMAGTGKDVLYVARADEDDLSYLARYALPLCGGCGSLDNGRWTMVDVTRHWNVLSGFVDPTSH